MRMQVFRVFACVVLVTAAFLASRTAAQTITPYPSGPPFHDPPSDTFKFRDLKAELKNKMPMPEAEQVEYGYRRTIQSAESDTGLSPCPSNRA